MSADASLLAEVPLFGLLDETERAALATHLEVVHFPVEHIVFQHGEPGDTLFIVRRGAVEMSFKNDTGEKIVLETAGPGDFFGELSFLDGGSRSATVRATEPTEALLMDRSDLDEFLRKYPAAALDLLTALGKRLRKTSELLRHTATRNVNEETEDRRTAVQKTADWIAEFSGSITFLMIHVALFTFWLAWNGLAPEPLRFDPFPYGFLTMCVSLEAIFLSVFVLLSQNRQAAKDRVRSDVEYEVNLRAELEVAHLHEKIDRLTADVLARLDGMHPSAGRAALPAMRQTGRREEIAAAAADANPEG